MNGFYRLEPSIGAVCFLKVLKSLLGQVLETLANEFEICQLIQKRGWFLRRHYQTVHFQCCLSSQIEVESADFFLD